MGKVVASNILYIEFESLPTLLRTLVYPEKRDFEIMYFMEPSIRGRFNSLKRPCSFSFTTNLSGEKS